MLLHLPLYNYDQISTLRRETNRMLEQNIYVGLPILPKWKKMEHFENIPELPKAVLLTYERQVSYGPCLLSILPSGYSGLCNLVYGDWHHIGKCKKQVHGGIVLIVDFAKSFYDTLFGGHVTVLDVLVYDSYNLVEFDFTDRYEIVKVLNNSLELPERYQMSPALLPEKGKVDKFNIYSLF